MEVLAGQTRFFVGPRFGLGFEVVREFPDTEPFVDAGCRLFLTRHGLTVVRRQDVTALRMT